MNATNSKKKPRKKIKLLYGSALVIASELGVKDSTVRSVLSRYNRGYHIYSEQGKKIIEKALETK